MPISNCTQCVSHFTNSQNSSTNFHIAWNLYILFLGKCNIYILRIEKEIVPESKKPVFYRKENSAPELKFSVRNNINNTNAYGKQFFMEQELFILNLLLVEIHLQHLHIACNLYIWRTKKEIITESEKNYYKENRAPELKSSVDLI